MFAFDTTPPLALYVHIPWCVRKCPYCDFNSHAAQHVLPEAAYVDALLKDLEHDLPDVWGRTIESVFLGGGTPSLLSADSIDRLLNGIRARLALKPGAEITLEANPGTFEQEKFSGYRQAGVNRLSIGVQSFEPASLKALGRIHDAHEAVAAVYTARAAGFDNVNLDLMFGLPGQTRDQALADLEQAMALQPEHLSWYQLTLEPNTAFHHAPPPLPDDETIWAIWAAGYRKLEDAGWHQYEVSAYAHNDRQCRHNLNYWRFGDYLGIGAGAHAKLTLPARQQIRRTHKHRHPDAYLAAANGDFVAGERLLAPADAAFDYMLNRLRLREGFIREDFERKTGLPFSLVGRTLAGAVEDGLLAETDGVYRHTERGWLFIDAIVSRFLPDGETHA
jgi:oxygen-independent coproporphyrinogen-3 oxidase